MTVLEDFVADLAVDAFVMLAVVLIEMEKGLGVSGVLHMLAQ